MTLSLITFFFLQWTTLQPWNLIAFGWVSKSTLCIVVSGQAPSSLLVLSRLRVKVATDKYSTLLPQRVYLPLLASLNALFTLDILCDIGFVKRSFVSFDVHPVFRPPRTIRVSSFSTRLAVKVQPIGHALNHLVVDSQKQLTM